jgi:hypothetical protein
MAEPHRFKEVMNYSFVGDAPYCLSILLTRVLTQFFATAVYALIGIVGYLMFGNDVNDEVSGERFSISPSLI